jgi:hypothetical protein
MGLPVLLSVLQEDRDDLELLKGALEVLQLAVTLPDGFNPAAAAAAAAAAGPGGQQVRTKAGDVAAGWWCRVALHSVFGLPACVVVCAPCISPQAAANPRTLQERALPPALLTADLFCRAPDNVLLLVSLLRPPPEGCDDVYARYSTLQALGALLAACPDKVQVRALCVACVAGCAAGSRRMAHPCFARSDSPRPVHWPPGTTPQACVLSSAGGGVMASLMALLTPQQPPVLEVLRNEALLLLVGLCRGCPELAKMAAFDGAFEALLGICGADGGPGGGEVVVQDAAEALNNLLRGNVELQRLFRCAGRGW